MIKQSAKKILITALIAVGTTLVPTPATAALMVDIGGTAIGGVYTPGNVYFDNQPGVDGNPVIGIIDLGTYLNTIATDFNIRGFSAASSSPFGSMTVNANANIVSSAVVPLVVTILITDTGFLIPSTPLHLSQTVNLLSSTGGPTVTSTAVGFYGDSNTAFDVNGPATATASSALTGGVDINIPGSSGTITGPPLYSLSTFIRVDIPTKGTDQLQNVQLNANLSASGVAIPEPASGMLLGGGLLCLAAFLRKK